MDWGFRDFEDEQRLIGLDQRLRRLRIGHLCRRPFYQPEDYSSRAKLVERVGNGTGQLGPLRERLAIVGFDEQGANAAISNAAMDATWAMLSVTFVGIVVFISVLVGLVAWIVRRRCEGRARPDILGLFFKQVGNKRTEAHGGGGSGGNSSGDGSGGGSDHPPRLQSLITPIAARAHQAHNEGTEPFTDKVFWATVGDRVAVGRRGTGTVAFVGPHHHGGVRRRGAPLTPFTLFSTGIPCQYAPNNDASCELLRGGSV